mmetsp:Transcript_6507/g.18711  ORF Transcript_6507/g.18711 Transcript_6507/m.18711 type:complete len:883 (-) Transcript_6507:1046-3694(-)
MSSGSMPECIGAAKTHSTTVLVALHIFIPRWPHGRHRAQRRLKQNFWPARHGERQSGGRGGGAEAGALGHLARRGSEVAEVLLAVVVRRHLRQPLILYLRHRADELLAGHHQFIVHHTSRQRLCQPILWVHVHGLFVLDGAIVATALQLGRVEEEACRDSLFDSLVVLRVGDHVDFHTLHEAHQLIPHIARALHGPNLHKVLEAKLRGEVGLCPGIVHVHQRDVVTDIAPVEVLVGVVGVHRLVLGAIEYRVPNGQHGTDGGHLLSHLVLLGGEDRFGHHGIQRELSHAAPQLGQFPPVVEGTQGVQLLQGAQQRLRRRRVHEVEVHQIVDAQALQHQHHRAKIGALDLRDGILLELVLKRPSRVQPEGLAGGCAPCAASSLQRRSSADRRDLQAEHARPRVVAVLLAEPRINDVPDAVDGQGRLCDVGGQHNLARVRRSGLEDLGLQIGRQVGVNGGDDHLHHFAAHAASALLEQLLAGLDLFLPREKHQDIAARLREVHLQRRQHRGIHVVRLGLLGVEDVHRIPTSGDPEDGGVIEVLAELLGVQGGAGDEELDVGPEASNVLDQAEQNVRVQRALVGLVHHHHAVGCQVRLAQELSQQHAIRHVLEHRFLRRAVLEADGVPHLLPQLAPHLLGNTGRDRHSSDAAGLCASDAPSFAVPRLMQILRNLSGFTRAGLADNDQDLVFGDSLQKALLVLVHGQQGAGVLQGLERGALGLGPLLLLVHLHLPIRLLPGKHLALDKVDAVIEHVVVRLLLGLLVLGAGLHAGAGYLMALPVLLLLPGSRLLLLLAHVLVACSEDFIALVAAVGAFGIVGVGHAIDVFVLDVLQVLALLLGQPQHLLLVLQLRLLLLRQLYVPEHHFLIANSVLHLLELGVLALS